MIFKTNKRVREAFKKNLDKNFVVSVLTSTGPFWVSSVAFCGADPGFKEATGLCSGLEAADPTICHFGRDLVPPWSRTVGSKSTKTVLKKEY